MLRGLSVFPWRPQEEGPLLVPFDLPGLGLAPCPGDVPEGRGECLLAAGKLQEALEQFAEAAARPGGSPLASLRLGDLALASDDPALAAEHWRRAAGEFPFGRLVTARLCELEPRCLRGAERPAFFDASLAAEPVRHDLFIRGARLRLLEGDRLGALEALVGQMSPRGACADVMPWCRRVLLDGLRQKGPDGAAALKLYLEVPGREQGPLAAELGRAASDQAAAAGAPIFAANLLASVTGRVPEPQQPAHLKQVARLFLAGGDRARAEEIVLFARAKLDRATWRREGWEALLQQVRALPAAVKPGAAAPAAPSATASPPATAAGTDPDVAMARAAVEAARAVAPPTGEHAMTSPALPAAAAPRPVPARAGRREHADARGPARHRRRGPHRPPPCSCSASRAPARRCWPATSTPAPSAPPGPGWPSTARPSRPSSSSRSSSATSAAPSPAPTSAAPAASSRPPAAPCSSTRWPSCPPPSRPSCSASSRPAR